MTLKSDLDRRAKALLDASAATKPDAEGVEQPDVDFALQIAAFKAVATYYAATQKGAKAPPPEETGETFDQLIKKIKQPHGTA